MMRDSVNASNIPLDTPVVAGYADGAYQWTPADWARFPAGTVRLTIATRATTQADILDIEQGDATPANAPGWCDRFRRPGRRRPTLYCSRAAWSAVQSAVGNRPVDYWIADYTGVPHDLPGAVAVQYHDFGGYDESNIIDATWVDYEMTLQNARTTAWAWFPAILGRRPESQAAVDYWANRLVSENGEAVLTDFCNTPEAVARLKP